MTTKLFHKKFLILFLSFAASLIVCGSSYADLTDGLIAYYPFNGNANDESGSGYHGTVSGAALTNDRFGEQSAYYFDGTDDYITIDPDVFDPSGNTTGFTITAWVKADDLYYDGQNAVRPIIFKKKYGGYDYAPQFELILDGRFHKDTASLFLGVDDSPAGYSYVGETGHVEVNKWYFVAGVYDHNLQQKSLYVNDQFIASTSHTSFPSPSTYEVTIGKTAYGHYFKGVIDDIRIYNRALSAVELNELYYGCAGTDYNNDGVVNKDDLVQKQNDILNSIQLLQEELRKFSQCWDALTTCQ